MKPFYAGALTCVGLSALSAASFVYPLVAFGSIIAWFAAALYWYRPKRGRYQEHSMVALGAVVFSAVGYLFPWFALFQSCCWMAVLFFGIDEEMTRLDKVSAENVKLILRIATLERERTSKPAPSTCRIHVSIDGRVYTYSSDEGVYRPEPI